MTAFIKGIGACIPPKIITNHEISTYLDTSDEWIFERTGIKERRVVDSGISTLDLAVKAGERAMKSAQCDSVDLVIVATTSPERICPAVAPEVASRLGQVNIAAYDITSACSGFVYGLATATGAIESGLANTVLLIGAEAFTRFVNPEDRTTLPIFGDGAGAVIITKDGKDIYGAIGSFDLGSDGSMSDELCVPYGGARNRGVNLEDLNYAKDKFFLYMNGRTIYEKAVEKMTMSSQLALEKNNLTTDEIDWFIGHQANARIINTVAYELNLEDKVVAKNIENLGNTLTASIPLLLNDYAEKKEIHPGDRLLISSFGAGLSWGSTVITWPKIEVYSKEW